jgi:hypothetical protein
MRSQFSRRPAPRRRKRQVSHAIRSIFGANRSEHGLAPVSTGDGRALHVCPERVSGERCDVKLILLISGVLFATPALMYSQLETPEPGGNPATAAVPPVWLPASPPPLPPLTTGKKIERRALGVVAPLTLFTSAFGAGFGQLRNQPPEWGQGAAGFGRRFANAEGYTATHNAVALASDLTFHIDPRYRRMPQARFLPRLRNALTETFVGYTDSGERIFNISEVAGSLGTGMIANAWEPRESSGIRNGIRRGSMGLVYHTLKNIAVEFLPDVLHHGR